MISAIQQGCLGKRFSLVRNGEVVAQLTLSTFRDRAELDEGGREARFFRDRESKGRPFVLETAGARIASARKPSLFCERIDLVIGERPCTLEKPSLWRRTYVLYDDGAEVGRIVPRSWWKKTADIDLPENWPVALQAFVLWLVVVMWRRQDAARGA